MRLFKFALLAGALSALVGYKVGEVMSLPESAYLAMALGIAIGIAMGAICESTRR